MRSWKLKKITNIHLVNYLNLFAILNRFILFIIPISYDGEITIPIAVLSKLF